jgi:hypothetical protein
MKREVKEESWADLEIFTSKGAKIKNPWVTLTDNSAFIFNAAFVHQASITKYTHVILGYSPLKKMVTFQFTSDADAEGALTVVHRPGGASIGSRSFFNYFFLNVAELAGRYVPKRIKLPKIGDVWTIDLDSKLPEK